MRSALIFRKCWRTGSGTAWTKETDKVMAVLVCAAAMAALFIPLAGQAAGDSIYSCVDAKGRRLTADRPIIDCIDREQSELSSGGMLRRKIGPSLTAAERAAKEDEVHRQEEERGRQADEKKREKALVTRYPDRGVHDKERAAALALVDSVTAAAHTRTQELLKQRKFLDGEVEFYKIDPSRMPAKLRRQIDEVDKQLDAQRRFVVDQEVEKVRVNARFDEELARLKLLWAQQGAVPMAVVRAASASAPRPAASAVRAAR
jgi:hypothetical protein